MKYLQSLFKTSHVWSFTLLAATALKNREGSRKHVRMKLYCYSKFDSFFVFSNILIDQWLCCHSPALWISFRLVPFLFMLLKQCDFLEWHINTHLRSFFMCNFTQFTHSGYHLTLHFRHDVNVIWHSSFDICLLNLMTYNHNSVKFRHKNDLMVWVKIVSCNKTGGACGRTVMLSMYILFLMLHKFRTLWTGMNNRQLLVSHRLLCQICLLTIHHCCLLRGSCS